MRHTYCIDSVTLVSNAYSYVSTLQGVCHMKAASEFHQIMDPCLSICPKQLELMIFPLRLPSLYALKKLSLFTFFVRLYKVNKPDFNFASVSESVAPFA